MVRVFDVPARPVHRLAAVALTAATNLVETTRSTSYTDATAGTGNTYTYYVAALDRLHHEGNPSAGKTVDPAGGPLSVARITKL